MNADNFGNSRRTAGEAIRTALLGSEFIARERAARTGFDQPFQELVTDFLWGGLWTRKGLDQRTRALIDVAILGALGRGQGVAVHVEAALRVGCSEQEIQETLLHVSVIAGVSAGADAFRASKSAVAAFAANQSAGQ